MTSEAHGGGLLHNMSVPPQTIITWQGLGSLLKIHQPGGSGLTGVKYTPTVTFGIPVRFVLPEPIARKPPAPMLRHLGHRVGPDPTRELAALIDAHAATLPMPDGCAVVASQADHLVAWMDTLSVLAALTKSSGAVWLRAKTPSLTAQSQRRAVSLLFPPAFAVRIPEISS